MYKKIVLLTLLLSVAGTAAETSIVNPQDVVANELSHLDQLIDATEKSLAQQRRLRELIGQYQEMQKRYLDNSEDNELLFQLIKTAYTILESIKAQHLELAFEPEFLSELSLLSKPAMKSGIPKP